MNDAPLLLEHDPQPFATADARWQAVCERDPAAEHHFVYAVRTTGVYCRPSCPARRPKRENVRFYACYEDAEAAGYRPCKRCRPNEVSREQHLVAQVTRLIEEVDAPPTLQALGERLGLSPHHLQRTFKRATGLSPRQYAAALREERFKRNLEAGSSVTAAMYEAGYGSSRALYSRARQQLGMTPGRYRAGGAGESLSFTTFATPLGLMLLAASAQGLAASAFGEREELLIELRRRFPKAQLVEDDASLAPYRQAVERYLAGDVRALTLPLSLEATDFQRRVWDALKAIPFGETRSYQQIAAAIGQPLAARAVARACASNPVALVIPCHRVVGASGELCGYRWGAARKRALLERERERA
jgi:AraC family transcriptional regulator of adaptative response/methylated-DNA-[protein]-cysteine methyltransferase